MLNWAHVHLIINHLPVIGVLGAFLLLIYAVIRKSDEVRTISFALFVLIALITVAVYFTGTFAEKVVKNLPGVTEAYIGRHEEMGELSLILMSLLGAASLWGLVIRRRTGSIPKCTLGVVIVMSLVTSVAMGITANLGGQIRHTEIRAGAPSPAVPEAH
jgi:uncharacterized membrane protein